MESQIPPSHLTLSELERSTFRCWKWSKIYRCIVRYCVSVNASFKWFSLQQWVFDTSLQKTASVMPNAVVKQSARVHGPLVNFQNYVFVFLIEVTKIVTFYNNTDYCSISDAFLIRVCPFIQICCSMIQLHILFQRRKKVFFLFAPVEHSTVGRGLVKF